MDDHTCDAFEQLGFVRQQELARVRSLTLANSSKHPKFVRIEGTVVQVFLKKDGTMISLSPLCPMELGRVRMVL